MKYLKKFENFDLKDWKLPERCDFDYSFMYKNELKVTLTEDNGQQYTDIEKNGINVVLEIEWGFDDENVANYEAYITIKFYEIHTIEKIKPYLNLILEMYNNWKYYDFLIKRIGEDIKEYDNFGSHYGFEYVEFPKLINACGIEDYDIVLEPDPYKDGGQLVQLNNFDDVKKYNKKMSEIRETLKDKEYLLTGKDMGLL